MRKHPPTSMSRHVASGTYLACGCLFEEHPPGRNCDALLARLADASPLHADPAAAKENIGRTFFGIDPASGESTVTAIQMGPGLGNLMISEPSMSGKLITNGAVESHALRLAREALAAESVINDSLTAVNIALVKENDSLRQQVLMLRTYPPLVLNGDLRFQWDADNGVWINITPAAATADAPIHRALRAHSHQTIGVRLP